MEFVETKTFSQNIIKLISDEELARLQFALVLRPDVGKLTHGSGGLRKLRWISGVRGKRGGVRIIYYWYGSEEIIYLLLAYKKSAKEDLTQRQLKVLMDLIKDERR